MKLSIERSALLKALAHVQTVVEKRNTIPILSNVLLKAEQDKLFLTATDMDLTIIEGAPASISQNGSITAPAHTLYEIVRKLPEGAQIELSLKDAQLTIRSGRSRFTLGTLPVGDFPAYDNKPLLHKFALPASELRGLIDRTRFAILQDETRYYLNGIYIHATKSNDVPVLRAVATDGHRLARIEMPLPEGAAKIPGVIIPRKTIGEIRKLIEEVSTTVEISLSETQIRFALDGIVLSSKLIDGTFPDYERVIPADNDKILIVDRKSFAEAVDRVATISSEKSRAIKLSLNAGALTLSAQSAESGQATEEIEVKYDSDAIEIGFNSRYLLDIAQQIDSEGAQFKLSDGASPTIIQDPADTTSLYVLMPMRV
ncbi:MAG: DNA polymerase III subunit beta [Alphaproteobacteria bacterium]|nr:MAG: DNA polymerase III subunit beta [Alphaproteobacteria bacterium]